MITTSIVTTFIYGMLMGFALAILAAAVLALRRTDKPTPITNPTTEDRLLAYKRGEEDAKDGKHFPQRFPEPELLDCYEQAWRVESMRQSHPDHSWRPGGGTYENVNIIQK